MKQGIFDVDVKGLRQLQEGKPKWIILRELLQNAMDEDVQVILVDMSYSYGKASITVCDDSPIGFRDLSDAYTLFKDTYKRSDVKKRGRFNFGEKQVICLCDYVRIETTTGGVEFDVLKGTRKQLRTKRAVGSSIKLEVKMTREEYDECEKYLKVIKPGKIRIEVRTDDHGYELWLNMMYYKTFTGILKTEVKEDDRMKTVVRAAEIELYEEPMAFIYEMGIPICEIDCPYSINVQQKVPLSNDRDKVDGKYLKDLFALVLNHTVNDITEDNISQTWIREAMDSDKVEPAAIVEVKEKRFGEDAVIFNPFDPNANDEAISKGYKLIYGSEMSSNEWSKMKSHAGLVSSTKLFGKGVATDCEEIEWQKVHDKISSLTKRMAVEFLNISIEVSFYRSKQVSALASYGGRKISYNCSTISQDWFEPDVCGYVKKPMLDLIVHELAHEKGNHTEHSYHECITSMAAEMTIKAIYQKDFFKIK